MTNGKVQALRDRKKENVNVKIRKNKADMLIYVKGFTHYQCVPHRRQPSILVSSFWTFTAVRPKRPILDCASGFCIRTVLFQQSVHSLELAPWNRTSWTDVISKNLTFKSNVTFGKWFPGMTETERIYKVKRWVLWRWFSLVIELSILVISKMDGMRKMTVFWQNLDFVSIFPCVEHNMQNKLTLLKYTSFNIETENYLGNWNSLIFVNCALESENYIKIVQICIK
jgi:hypothetical protein